MNIPNVRKEDILSPEEEFFAKIIQKLEGFLLTEEENLIYLHIYISRLLQMQ